jgi:hypothetical protein
MYFFIIIDKKLKKKRLQRVLHSSYFIVKDLQRDRKRETERDEERKGTHWKKYNG